MEVSQTNQVVISRGGLYVPCQYQCPNMFYARCRYPNIINIAVLGETKSKQNQGKKCFGYRLKLGFVQLGPNWSLNFGPRVNTKLTVDSKKQETTENFLKGSRQSRWPGFSMYASNVELKLFLYLSDFSSLCDEYFSQTQSLAQAEHFRP